MTALADFDRASKPFRSMLKRIEDMEREAKREADNAASPALKRLWADLRGYIQVVMSDSDALCLVIAGDEACDQGDRDRLERITEALESRERGIAL